MKVKIHGVLPALLTPRTTSGKPDLEAFERLIDFDFERGVDGVAVCGGTGDYASLNLTDRKLLIERAHAAVRGRGQVICSCGAVRLEESTELAKHALAVGADAVLLPPPHFYLYSQEDLEGYYAEAAQRIDGPVLLYNLAAFVTPLQPATSMRLMRSAANIVGIKDSSGRLDVFESITETSNLDPTRILGHDTVLAEALRRGLIDAAISGPATVVPEATAALFAASKSGDSQRVEALTKLYDELLERVAALPYPWALMELADVREIFPARYPFSPSSHRQQALDALREWFPTWLDRLSTVNLSGVR